MRFAYADPPYVGQAKLYKGHADYAGEVDHRWLVSGLIAQYPDGWALSCSTPSLAFVLGLCPDEVRVCAWFRGQTPRPPARVMWCWEPLILYAPHWRLREGETFMRDAIYAHQPSGFIGGEITGQKPVGFCNWVFGLLGAGPDDELDDIFPGSGAVGQAWDAWRSQLSLLGHKAQQEQPAGLPEQAQAPEATP